MPFSRPALNELITRTRNDIVSRLQNPDLLRRSDADVYARALSGVAHGILGYIDWLSKQLIYDTAEAAMLERWASIWSVTRKPAAVATGSVTFTGSNGATVPSGTVLAAYDGQLYETTAIATIASGTATAAVIAQAAGVAGNRVTGQLFTLQAPIAGIQATATAAAMVGGADIETDDALRGRLITRIQQPPHGGAKHDYIAWALEVPGVTRAWAYPAELGVGTVSVRFVRDNDASIIPDAGEVAAVQAYIQERRPVTAVVYVLAPVAVPLNLTISGLNPSNADVKAAVISELASLIAREATPGGTIYLSHIKEAISIATGEVDHVLTTPSANVVSSAGNITTLGTVTWA